MWRETPSFREVMCQVDSITRNEFFDAGRNGLNPEFKSGVKKWPERTLSRKNGLDAIHDTVHEMARDEARHGVALKGMLERYFK